MNYKKFLGAASAALMIVIAIFMLAPGAWAQSTYKVLYTFAGGKTDGSGPDGNLIFDAAGNLYGVTSAGGPHATCLPGGCGTVFKLAPNSDGTWTESVLYIFSASGKSGAGPSGSLVFDKAGNLYGTTWGGGTYGNGVVFKLTPNADGSWKEKILHQFTDKLQDGGEPNGSLIFDAAGNLYGTTELGGTTACGYDSGCGLVFKLTPNADGSWKKKVLHKFHGRDGYFPLAGLIFDTAGSFYGTASVGGTGNGVVFEITP